MCERTEQLIEIQEKTDIGKYEFLRAYYTMWNFITKASPRAIIDTHAGTGIVNYPQQNKRLYGSPILAILKTYKISNRLIIHLNEKNTQNYATLRGAIDDISQNGVPVFRRIPRYVRVRNLWNPEVIDEVEENATGPPRGFGILPRVRQQSVTAGTYSHTFFFARARIVPHFPPLGVDGEPLPLPHRFSNNFPHDMQRVDCK